jgi:hypothetical protein
VLTSGRKEHQDKLDAEIWDIDDEEIIDAQAIYCLDKNHAYQ